MPSTTSSIIRRALADQTAQIQAMAALSVAAHHLPNAAGVKPDWPLPEGKFTVVSLLPVIYGRPFALVDLTRERLPLADTYRALLRWKTTGLLASVQLHRSAASSEAWSVSSLSVAASAVALHSVVSAKRGPASDWLFVCSPLRFQALVRSNLRSTRARVIQSGITDLRSGPWFGVHRLAEKLALADHRLQTAAVAASRRTLPPISRMKRKNLNPPTV